MGYTFNSLSRILGQESLFRGKKILTLGTLYPFVSPHEARMLAQRGVFTDTPKERFSNHLFVEVLAATSCHSLDVSDYQQSEIICNLNHPVAQEYVGKYDVVFDGGTLEHLSNLPTALGNIFSLLRTGGIYYFGGPCNNWVDHGFFQFSPTFYSDLCLDNPDLELLDLHVSTPQRYYDYGSQNLAFKGALFNSRQRLTVGGIIRKTGGRLNFDLTQSKYREQHAPAVSRAGGGTSTTGAHSALALRRRASSAIQWFAATAWIPLCIKEAVLNYLYTFRRRDRDNAPQNAPE